MAALEYFADNDMFSLGHSRSYYFFYVWHIGAISVAIIKYQLPAEFNFNNLHFNDFEKKVQKTSVMISAYI